MSTWCRVCCTEHEPQGRCPGELQPTGPEREGWKIIAETPGGMQGYGVLLAEVGRRWRARILTFPNIPWVLPGGDGAIKFLGRTPEEAELKAARFIREHCTGNGYTLRDGLELVDSPAVPFAISARPGEGVPRVATRFARQLPVRFGENAPTIVGRTVNLSATGLFVYTDYPLEAGLLAGLLLELEHCKLPLRGSVVWVRRIPGPFRPPGMGLALFNPPTIYQRYIQALE